jgi:DNA invertase Pin-like site-specific DNA recombinase
MTMAVALLRVSTERQQLGLDAQRAAISAYAASHDIEVIAWHTEIVSGGAAFEDRYGLQAAMADVSSLEASHLLVAKRDRFSRDPLVAMLTERSLEKLGASVVCADGNNETDPASELIRHILDGVARFERRMIGLRTKAALAARKAAGHRLGRPPGIVETEPRKRRTSTATKLPQGSVS